MPFRRNVAPQPMNRVLLDASALLALLQGEPGSDAVEAALGVACMSAVNFSEVVAKLQDYGMPPDAALAAASAFGLEILPLEPEVAGLAGRLRTETRGAGLTLGDRCCVATALNAALPVLTTERVWSELEIGVEVQNVRPRGN